MAAITAAMAFSPNKRRTTHPLRTPNPSITTPHSLTIPSLNVKKHSFFLLHIPSAASPLQFFPATIPTEISCIGENTNTNKKEGFSFGSPPIRILLLLASSIWLLLAVLLVWGGGTAAAAAAAAAADSISASNFGLKVATALRRFGWPDEAVIFALATLPVLELRGAIPVGYWMQLKPLRLTILSVLGNMVPVPFIILYLKRFATFLAGKNASASRFLELLFERATEKAGPIEEFQWLGLMLFVAVPFPGTGAWTGAMIASILDMPFWSGLTANFFGVVFAGLLVNLLVNLGLKYAVLTGFVLFLVSTFMWTVLRNVKKSLNSN
ncbi:uncharacterized protein LOC131223563 [Magnolia sinica]|uniref:uncharacterized protein LOC131223563 n=1 Tax=Magnolia sinica TaxID=86752 RepID=UPI00265AAD2A|nr:uncharacterized protein LOC131223563 [Magnolia sinica]